MRWDPTAASTGGILAIWLDLAGSGVNVLISVTRPEAIGRVGLGPRAEDLDLLGLSYLDKTWRIYLHTQRVTVCELE